MDEGGFVLDYRAAAGHLADRDRPPAAPGRGHHQQATPRSQTYSRRTGAQLGGGLTEANKGDFFVRLKPLPPAPSRPSWTTCATRSSSQVPGLDIEMAQLMEDLIGDLTAVPQPIEIKLYGDDTGELLQTAPKVAARDRARSPAWSDVRNGIVLAGDALDIKVDRAQGGPGGHRPGQP